MGWLLLVGRSSEVDFDPDRLKYGARGEVDTLPVGCANEKKLGTLILLVTFRNPKPRTIQWVFPALALSRVIWYVGAKCQARKALSCPGKKLAYGNDVASRVVSNVQSAQGPRFHTFREGFQVCVSGYAIPTRRLEVDVKVLDLQGTIEVREIEWPRRFKLVLGPFYAQFADDKEGKYAEQTRNGRLVRKNV